MKKIKFDKKKNEFKLQVQNNEDLWTLSTIIKPGDFISGKTPRKIKYGDQKEKSERKLIFAKIQVEKSELSNTADYLKILGTIVEAPEDVPYGTHHSFNLEANSVFTLIKPGILKFEFDKLDEATKQTPLKILICVHDREEAYFALVKNFGYQFLSSTKGEVSKKIDNQKKTENFYQKINNILQDYVKRYELEHVIIASPAFFKEDLLKEINEKEIKDKIILSNCSIVNKSSFDEVLKRSELKTLLEQNKAAKEMKIVEDIFTAISKEGKVVYGFKEVKLAAESGAVEKLAISDKLIQKYMEAEDFEKLENIMKNTEQSKGEVHIVNSKNEAGKKLDGLGGIGGLLRFKLNY